MFTAESDGERILKIRQHLAKLWARVGCPVFFDSRGISITFCSLNEIVVIFRKHPKFHFHFKRGSAKNGIVTGPVASAQWSLSQITESKEVGKKWVSWRFQVQSIEWINFLWAVLWFWKFMLSTWISQVWLYFVFEVKQLWFTICVPQQTTEWTK